MGGALLRGWLAGGVIKPAQLVILDPKPGEAAKEAISSGAAHITQASDIPASVTTVLLGIKPQMARDFAKTAKAHIPKSALLISILAGTSIAELSELFGARPIIRAMPNTPAAIGKGITAIAAGRSVKPAHIDTAKSLLSAAGAVHLVAREDLIDAVTAISGSGPAYIFHMCEALEAAAIRLGLPDELAADFARQTIIGAGALLEDSEDSPKTLRQNVTSPNGTTQAALDVLMADGNGLRAVMGKACKAAYERAKQLAGR